MLDIIAYMRKHYLAKGMWASLDVGRTSPYHTAQQLIILICVIILIPVVTGSTSYCLRLWSVVASVLCVSLTKCTPYNNVVGDEGQDAAASLRTRPEHYLR